MAGELTYIPTLPALACATPVVPAFAFDLFGGASFSLPLFAGNDDPLKIFGRGLQQLLGPFAVFAPLKPVLQAVAAVVQAIPQLPNPIPLIQALQQIAVAVGDLASLVIFPVQLARTVKGSLTVLIGYLTALKARIVSLGQRYTNVNNWIGEATRLGNGAMLQNANCAKERLDADAARLVASYAGAIVIVQIISLLICIAALGHLEPLPTLDPGALVAEVFDPPIAALTTLRDLIPEPPGVPLRCG